MTTGAVAKGKPAPVDDGPRVQVDFADLQRHKLTGREVREFERVQGLRYVALQRVFQSGDIPYDTLLALVWLLWRRQEPGFTFDDMLELTEDEWTIRGVAISEPDPTAAPDAAQTGS